MDHSQTYLALTMQVSRVSADLQEYFFPKEDATVKQRQQQWAKSVALRRKSVVGVGDPEKSSLHPSLHR